MASNLTESKNVKSSLITPTVTGNNTASFSEKTNRIKAWSNFISLPKEDSRYSASLSVRRGV